MLKRILVSILLQSCLVVCCEIVFEADFSMDKDGFRFI